MVPLAAGLEFPQLGKRKRRRSCCSGCEWQTGIPWICFRPFCPTKPALMKAVNMPRLRLAAAAGLLAGSFNIYEPS